MKREQIRVGFIPLTDAAPLIVAHELGFADEEGLQFELVASPTWSHLRDQLSFGQVDAAHMLSPVPVAGALGLGGAGAELQAISVLSINGNVIGVSADLSARLHSDGHDFAFNNATAAGKAIIRAMGQDLRIGVPFPFSMHAELVYYWLTALGLPAPQSIYIRTVPPPLMADALSAGEIDTFCVGEPWGSRAVEEGVGDLLLPGAAIWSFAPEKVLAVRKQWVDDAPDIAKRLIRAAWKASRWLSKAESFGLTAEILSKAEYLNLPSHVVERALGGSFVITRDGQTRQVANYLDFFSGAAGFPWKSQAEWIARQMAMRVGLDQESATRMARNVFRSDLYRQALAEVVPDLPSSSSKVEGALSEPTAVGSMGGRLILPPDRFFDGRIFEPSGNT